MGIFQDLSDKTREAIDIAKALTAIDGWENPTTNMGIGGKDKAEAVRYRARRLLTHQTLDDLYRQDGLAALIVDDIVDEAMRAGWRITFPSPSGGKTGPGQGGASPDTDESKPDKGNASIGSGDTEPVPPDLVNSINWRVKEWHRQTFFPDRAWEHLTQARAFGGAVFVLGVNDGRPPNEPLDLSASGLNFNWCRSLDRFQVAPSGTLVADPSSPWYGLPVWYQTTSVVAGQTGSETSLGPGDIAGIDDTKRSSDPLVTGEVDPNSTQAAFSFNNTHVHTTRVWRTDGSRLSERSRLNNLGWGESILERCFDPLRHYNSAMKATGTIIQDFAQGVYKLRGFKELISSEKSGLIHKRFSIIDRVRSIVNAVVVDAENEDFERKTTSVQGLPDLIDRAQLWLSAVSRMPITRLFGVSPGGFGTGAHEGENWNTKVAVYQDKVLRPLLEYVYGLLFQTAEFSDVPDGWQIEFNPLEIETPDQIADRRAKNAQTDAMYMLHGALFPSEVARSRFGGAVYGSEIALDFEARERMESAAPIGETLEDDAQQTAADLNANALQESADHDTVKPTGRGTSTTLEVAAARTGASAEDAGNVGPEGAPEPAAAQPPTEIQKTALNGGQISALQKLTADVVAGNTPVESAIGTALYSFPTMTDAEARAIFEPAARKAEEDEAERAKNPPPVPPTPPQGGLPIPPGGAPPEDPDEPEDSTPPEPDDEDEAP